mmetsp:Transcript_43922/g.87116  ORF Transcript_43922/g.87116 Transcript_43922/m.87116 type:complete len:218 (-) Transcript_43922:406-1059(-)
MASWCEPLKAVYTRLPDHGNRSGTLSSLQYSATSIEACMSLRSISGSMPWENRFIASVTRQTLPVRSPLPNKHPSTRSAPAIMPSSAHATPHPRSLCGCNDRMTFSRFSKCAHIHSIWSAYTLGVDISTVDGRLMISLSSGFGARICMTASQTSRAKSSSVPVNDSGEYSYLTFVPVGTKVSSAIFLTIVAPSVAIALIPARGFSKTTRRCSSLVEL